MIYLALLFVWPWMGFAIETADVILLGRTLVTMDKERKVVEDGAIAVQGDKIVAVGKRSEVLVNYQSMKTLGGNHSVILPGLINTHTHLPMTLFRGIANDKALMDWLHNYIRPLEEAHIDENLIQTGTELGCWELIRSGTTTFVDSYYDENLIAETTKRIGLRAICGHGTSDLKAASRFLKKWKGDPLITPAVAPHSVYTCNLEELTKAKELADKENVHLLIHAAESQGELVHSLKHFGTTPIRLLDKIGLLHPRTLLAHVVWVDDDELAKIHKAVVGIAHCPQSNMTLASGIARIGDMIRGKIHKIGLGTDGAASNQTLDLFEEMNLAAKLQKVNTLDPTELPAARVLEMATIGGARAIGLEDKIGSLEVGKQADIIVVTLDHPSVVPFYDIYSLLVYTVRGHNVSSVLVNGNVLMERKKMLTLDTQNVMQKVRELRPIIQQNLQKIQSKLL